jgi:hypothetical protein
MMSLDQFNNEIEKIKKSTIKQVYINYFNWLNDTTTVNNFTNASNKIVELLIHTKLNDNEKEEAIADISRIVGFLNEHRSLLSTFINLISNENDKHNNNDNNDNNNNNNNNNNDNNNNNNNNNNDNNDNNDNNNNDNNECKNIGKSIDAYTSCICTKNKETIQQYYDAFADLKNNTDLKSIYSKYKLLEKNIFVKLKIKVNPNNGYDQILNTLNECINKKEEEESDNNSKTPSTEYAEKEREDTSEPILDTSIPIAIAASVREPEEEEEDTPESILDPSIPIAIAASVRESEESEEDTISELSDDESYEKEPVKTISNDSITYVTPQGVVYIYYTNDPSKVYEYQQSIENQKNSFREVKLNEDGNIKVYQKEKSEWVELIFNNFKDLYKSITYSEENKLNKFFNNMVKASKWVLLDIAKNNK